MKSKPQNIIIVILLLVIAFLVGKYAKNDAVPEKAGKEVVVETKVIPVSITKANIKEDNFSGSKVIIEGTGAAAVAARQYISETINDFTASANTDVPDMRKQFGADSPMANYTIDINARLVKSNKTESIVIDQYNYTGGANGMSFYKVFTTSLAQNKVVPLSYLIKPEKQEQFTAYVKKKLMDWRPEGLKETVVFPDAVKDLTFTSFTDWSLDNKNLTIYFNKYDIGPGALGAVAFPLPITSIESYIAK